MYFLFKAVISIFGRKCCSLRLPQRSMLLFVFLLLILSISQQSFLLPTLAQSDLVANDDGKTCLVDKEYEPHFDTKSQQQMFRNHLLTVNA